jgi:hypothetical protein
MEARARRFGAIRGTLAPEGQERVTHLPPSFEDPQKDVDLGRVDWLGFGKTATLAPPQPSPLTSSPCLTSIADCSTSSKRVAVVSCLFTLGQLSSPWSVHIFCASPSLRATSSSYISKFTGRSSKVKKLTAIRYQAISLLYPSSKPPQPITWWTQRSSAYWLSD